MRASKALRGTAVVGCMAASPLLLALAGCGSTNKATTTTAAPVKTATYDVNLTHVTGSNGASNASGLVVLSVKAPSDELCWNISPVKNFTVSGSTATATIVTIQPTPHGLPSTPGFPLGGAYKSTGCVHAPSIFLGRLEAHPQMLYLSIYDTHSGEAVRGQI